MTRYFLDTTAQLERHAGASAVRSELEERLGKRSHATSSQVLREWKRIVELSAIDILNVIDEADRPTLGEVCKRLAQTWGRRPGQRLRVLGMMLDAEEFDVTTLRMRAEIMLRSESLALFHHQIDVVRDGSKCQLAQEPPVIGDHGRWGLRTQCKRTECDCVQPPFLEGRRAEIERIGSALTKTPGQEALGRRTLKVIAEPDADKRKGRNCWGGNGLGGDVSIGLECDEDEVLLTTDRSLEFPRFGGHLMFGVVWRRRKDGVHAEAISEGVQRGRVGAGASG